MSKAVITSLCILLFLLAWSPAASAATVRASGSLRGGRESQKQNQRRAQFMMMRMKFMMWNGGMMWNDGGGSGTTGGGGGGTTGGTGGTGGGTGTTKTYTMPGEEERHAATWLQWPHNYGWDKQHIQNYESAWVTMTKALHTGERVRIVSYDSAETARIKNVLQRNGVNLGQIDFFEHKTDDVWARDNGPIFAYDDATKELVIQDWGFNGWGRKSEYKNDDPIPSLVAKDLGRTSVVVDMVNEGGSVEIDGHGTLMAKKSSILNNNRNPRMSQAEAERIFTQYLGVTNFIWLDGVKGQDITDDHIDGTARFADDGKVIVTHKKWDFVKPKEYDILARAKNANGQSYRIVHLPLTRSNVEGTNYQGVYVNFYVANDVILMPWYNDPADSEAKGILEGLYPDKQVVGVHANKLYKDGGQAHCVTQQEPLPLP